MSGDTILLLIGAGIGLVATIIGAVVQHFLALREDAMKRERDEIYDEAERLRRKLLEGVTDHTLKGVYQDE